MLLRGKTVGLLLAAALPLVSLPSAHADEVQDLIGRLNASSVAVRGSAAEALGRIGDTRAIQPLIRALRDRAPLVRAFSVEALRNIGKPALTPIIHAFAIEDRNVRIGLARIVLDMGTASIAPLISAMNHPNVNVSFGSQAFLREIGRPAVEPLIDALRNRDFVIRCNAAWVLSEIRDRRAIEPLRRALNDSNERVRNCAEKALGKMGY